MRGLVIEKKRDLCSYLGLDFGKLCVFRLCGMFFLAHSLVSIPFTASK